MNDKEVKEALDRLLEEIKAHPEKHPRLFTPLDPCARSGIEIAKLILWSEGHEIDGFNRRRSLELFQEATKGE